MAKRRRGNGEGAFFRTGDKIWHYRLLIGTYPNGKNRYKEFQGQQKKDVAARVEAYKQKYGNRLPDDNANSAFADYILNWAKTVKSNEVKETSYNRLMSTIQVHICPTIGMIRLKELTSTQIQNCLINSMRDKICPQTGKKYSLSSIKKAFVYTKACLEYAAQAGVIEKNPCGGVTLPAKAQRPPKSCRFFNDNEAERFVRACRDSTCSTSWAIEAALYTGVREGELCALRPADIDLIRKKIYIHATIIKHKKDEKNSGCEFQYQPETKNGKSRVVPLNRRATELFSARIKQCSSDQVYLMTLSSKVFNMPTLHKQYKKICAGAGLESIKGLHDLRHTFASKLIRQGTDIKIVSELLGHSSVAFTYNTYVHLLDDQKENTVLQVEW